jgi:UDP-2-acetamido-2,6-beta-L-arabino-hexul-4-ose reductase
MNIGITGARGMIGWHLRCYLNQFPEYDSVIADRDTFANDAALRNLVRACPVIVHLAGQNRGADAEISDTNPRLARELVAACEAEAVSPHIIYASSTHVDSDSIYGKSKREAGRIFGDWAAKSGAEFTNLILPHVFGEATRPFYNSAVATFAHQLAIGEEPRILNNADLELVHAQDVCATILTCAAKPVRADRRVHGREITVKDVLDKLKGLASSYDEHVIPDLRDRFDLSLFNLYRYYLFPEGYPRALTVNSDERGYLVEAVKNLNGGQAFFSTTKPGVTRGNHYHYNKVERFLVVKGQATIRIRRLFDDHVHEFEVSGDAPAYVDMPTLHTHNITNIGDNELLTLFWSHEIFDRDRPDTIFEEV